ncbi:hypothetical protein MJN58_17575, partial [Salmonella enterica subsp. enterica serovar Montevideo]|nr:hypothetical protein [Salmonella enterica subsp. enterica serovar Montevideo]
AIFHYSTIFGFIKMVVTLVHPVVMEDGLCFVIGVGCCIVGAGVVAKVLG